MASAHSGAYGSVTWASRSYSGWGSAVALTQENSKGGGYASAAYGHTTYAGVSRGGAATTVSMAGAASSEAIGSLIIVQLIKPVGLASAGALGQPNTLYNQIISPVAVASSFAAGLYRTSVTWQLAAVGTAESFGGFTFKQAQYINTVGFTEFQAGLLSTSVTVPIRTVGAVGFLGQPRTVITVPMGGIATSETVSTPVVAQSIPALAITTGAAFGLFHTSVTVPMSGIPSAAAYGRPPPPAQTAKPILAAVSAEAVGQPIVGPIELIGSATSAETVSPIGAAIPGPVTVHMLGEVMSVVGRPSIAITLFFTGIQSTGGVSQFSAVRAQHQDMLGLASSGAFGQPIIPTKPVGLATGQAFGQPLVTVARTIVPAGAASAENVAQPRSVGEVYAVVGIGTSEAVSQLPPVGLSVKPSGVASGFAAGGFTYSVPAVNQTRAPAAVASAEAVGLPAVRTFAITLQGVPTGFAAGLLHTSVTVPIRGVVSAQSVSRFSALTRTVLMWPADSAEAVGLISIPAPQTIHPAGAASGFGQDGFNWTRAIVVYPIGASTGEVLLGPTFAFGGVSRQMQGLASAGVVGPAHYLQTISPAAVASAEAVSPFGAPLSVSPRGLASSGAVGFPDRPLSGTILRTMQGLASSGAFGPVHFKINVPAAGVASSEAAGNPTVVQAVHPAALPTSSSFGQPSIATLFVVPMGAAASAETAGNPSIYAVFVVDPLVAIPPPGLIPPFPPGTVTPSGQVPEPQINLTVPVGGVASSETLGAPQVNQAVNPTAVQTSESFGSPQPAAQTVYLQAVASAEQVGNPAWHGSLPVSVAGAATGELVSQFRTAVSVPIAGTASLETVPQPKLVQSVHPLGSDLSGAAGAPRPPAQRLPRLVGVPTGQAFGQPRTEYVEHARGAASAEALGRPKLHATIAVAPQGVGTAETFGLPAIPAQAVHPRGVVSSVALGQPAKPAQTERPFTSVPSSESFGAPKVVLYLKPAGVPTEAAVSQFTVHRRVPVRGITTGFAAGLLSTSVTVPMGAAATAEALGRPKQLVQSFHLVGVPTAELLGQPAPPNYRLRPILGVPTAEAVSRVTVHRTVPMRSVPSAEAVGAPSYRLLYTIRALAVPSGLTFGELVVHAVYYVHVGAGVPTAEAVSRFQVNIAFGVPGIGSEEAVSGIHRAGHSVTRQITVDPSVSTRTQIVAVAGRSLIVEVVELTLAAALAEKELEMALATRAESIEVTEVATTFVSDFVPWNH